jgi:hypothetical protein
LLLAKAQESKPTPFSLPCRSVVPQKTAASATHSGRRDAIHKAIERNKRRKRKKKENLIFFVRSLLLMHVCVYVVVSSSRVVIEEKRRERGREEKKKLFHQKWHRATVAVMSSIGLRLVQVDRTNLKFVSTKNYSPTNVF